MAYKKNSDRIGLVKIGLASLVLAGCIVLVLGTALQHVEIFSITKVSAALTL